MTKGSLGNRPVKRVWGAAFVLVALSAGLTLGFGQGWLTVFQATFAGVPDGQGDGISFPAEIGRVLTFTSSGQSFCKISPISGIYSEKLLLTDKYGVSGVDFGVRCLTGKPADLGLMFSCSVRLESEHTAFCGEITGTSGSDISRFMFQEDGAISINGSSTRVIAKPRVTYGLIILILPDFSGNAIQDFLLYDKDTGKELLHWIGEIGKYQPVNEVKLAFPGDTNGAVVLDDLLLKALSQ